MSWNYNKKRELFTLLPESRMSITVPSRWLADLVAQTYLAKYPIEIAPNSIDKTVFKPVETNYLQDKHGLYGKKIVLGVSTSWSDRKGLGDFIKLLDDLDDDTVVVLVGLDRKMLNRLSHLMDSRLVLLPKTDSVEELVRIYNSAHVFFNPTKEDTFPTVNLEAESCGTPVITYDVGGCSETIAMPESCCVSDYEHAVDAIRRILDT